MNDSDLKIESSVVRKKRPVPWLTLGMPLGCAIGIGLGNFALGLGCGLLLGAAASLFQAGKEGRKVGFVAPVALVVAGALVAVLLLRK